MSQEAGKTVNRVVKFMNNLESLALAYIPVVLCVFIVFEAVDRKLQVNLLNLFWLEEFSRVMFIFLTLLGASLAVKTGGHSNMDVVQRMLPKRGQHILVALVDLTCAVVLAWVGYYGWNQVARFARMGVSTSTLKIPFYIAYLPLAVFFVFMSIRYLIAMAKEIRSAASDQPREAGADRSRGGEELPVDIAGEARQ